MTKNVYISYSSECTASYHDGEKWSARYEFSVTDATLTPVYHAARHEVYPMDVKSGDTVYVLYMIYSEGDSFGRSDGNGEVLWCFKSEELANKAKRNVDENYNSYTIEAVGDDGKVIMLTKTAVLVKPMVVN